jgi:hypothetical protein
MTNKWQSPTFDGAHIEIDRDQLAKVLVARFGREVDAAAQRAAATARAALPAADMKARVRVKRHSQIDKGKGVDGNRFRVDWKARPKDLMHSLEVPVALVTVDSKLAAIWEYGRISKTGKPRRRDELFQMYRPLYLAIQSGKHYYVKRNRITSDGKWS